MTISEILEALQCGKALYMERGEKRRAYFINPSVIVAVGKVDFLINTGRIKEGPAVYKGNRYLLVS